MQRFFAAVLYWQPVLIPLLLSVGLGVALAERRYGLILHAFLNRAVLDPLRLIAYIAGLFVTEALLLVSLWGLTILLVKLLNRSDRMFRILFVTTACFLVVAKKFAEFQVLGYLGDFVRAKVVLKISDGGEGTLPYLLDHLNGKLPVILSMLLFGLVMSIIAWWIGRALPNRPAPRLKPVMLCILALAVTTCGIRLWTVKSPYDPLAIQLQRIPTLALAGVGMARATDFDSDGVGWLATPSDFAPFDSALHPYAIEIPGNGIDENGYGGDLPSRMIFDGPIVLTEPKTTPDILLVVECTFRYELLTKTIDGKPVMPFLKSLGERGYAGLAYSHQGSTIPGVSAILSGDPVHSRNSLLRDFKQRGYHTISALCQHEVFGRIGERFGLNEADQNFHAGMAVEDRINVSTAPSSLTLSAERTTRGLTEMLDKAPTDEPVFAFILLASLHYPYALDSPQTHFENEHVPIAKFNAQNKDAMIRMYDNAAANFDDQLKALYQMWDRKRSWRGEPVFVVIGDHGESFFEDESFGHGLELTEAQTATPIVLTGGWGQVPAPTAQSDLRRMLLSMLDEGEPVPNKYTATSRQRPIFQMIGELGQPLQIAWVDQSGRRVIDFARDTYTDTQGNQTPIAALPKASEGLKLIHEWESRVIAANSPQASE